MFPPAAATTTRPAFRPVRSRPQSSLPPPSGLRCAPRVHRAGAEAPARRKLRLPARCGRSSRAASQPFRQLAQCRQPLRQLRNESGGIQLVTVRMQPWQRGPQQFDTFLDLSARDHRLRAKAGGHGLIGRQRVVGGMSRKTTGHLFDRGPVADPSIERRRPAKRNAMHHGVPRRGCPRQGPSAFDRLIRKAS